MPIASKKFEIFVSYSRKDKLFVEFLLKKLDDLGYTYWIDVSGIESGDMFKKNIIKAIKASQVVLFVSSKASNVSPYTIKEINYAIHNHKPIIPIRIDNTEYNEVLQFDLDVLDYVDCTKLSKYQEGFERLFRALQHYFPNHQKSDSISTLPTDSMPKNERINWVKWLIFGVAFLIGLGFGIWGVVIATRNTQNEGFDADLQEVLTYEHDEYSGAIGMEATIKSNEIAIPDTMQIGNRDNRDVKIEKFLIGCWQSSPIDLGSHILFEEIEYHGANNLLFSLILYGNIPNIGEMETRMSAHGEYDFERKKLQIKLDLSTLDTKIEKLVLSDSVMTKFPEGWNVDDVKALLYQTAEQQAQQLFESEISMIYVEYSEIDDIVTFIAGDEKLMFHRVQK